MAHIVQQTLDGRPDRLKGYSIALDVFDRGATFDQLNDPVVRIEAGRLRLALERYYLLEGRFDAVIIDMPKGGYVARFSHPSRYGPDGDGADL